uniref:Tumor necrosis factor receptor superfamily member 23-like n=1 Tax=Petromyzon marinus TaxID=7757 RepID=A0AAJ7UE72_PETMA|nr:tumor necrosis factor receptor superfamily member 23-like [Petromyzon marinus]
MTQVLHWIVALLIVAFGLCSGTKADCPQGQYRASSGLCCLLCDAGTFKFEDCSTDGGYALCLSCSDGKYTDGDNQEPRCLTCTACGQHEVIEQDCKATQNRKCIRNAGFYRPENGNTCQEKSDVVFVIVAVTAGVLASIILVGVASLAYRWKRRQSEAEASGEQGPEEAVSESEVSMTTEQCNNHNEITYKQLEQGEDQ